MTIVMANYYDEGDVNELKFNRSTFPSHRLFAILSLSLLSLYHFLIAYHHILLADDNINQQSIINEKDNNE